MNDPVNQDTVVGKSIGDYHVIRRLGKGGMAEVYLAQQQSLQRLVALKLLKAELARDEEYVRRFRNEAQSAAALVHANIVQIYEVGSLAGRQFIAQEYVPGRNLKQLLDREISLDAQQTTAILRQVASALRKAELRGIVHRDIKPENILLGSDGQVKVADFGLARQNTPDQDGLELTKVGITMGTPLYMSPEQIEGRKLDSRSDIYSLGVTAYQMLTGRPPFDGDSSLSVALRHLQESPADLQIERPDVPPQLCAIVHRMLAKKPEERFADAAALLQELESLPIAAGRVEAGLAALADVDAGPHDASAFAETRELANLLQTAARPSLWMRLSPILLWAVPALLGAAVAWGIRPVDPLAAAVTSSDIPRKESADAQFIYATLTDTESAWKSVLDYFPLLEDASEKERLLQLRAKQQLAYWYILHNQPEQSLVYLEELASLDGTQNDLRARGLAWQAVAYDRMGEKEKAADVLASALTLTEFLDQPVIDELERLSRRLQQPSR